MLNIPKKDYSDGRTKQSFKDETDINKLLARAQRSGTISHLDKYSGQYGDFADFDFFETQLKLAQGREIFDALPSEIRDEFRQSPADFYKYVNDPENTDDLLKKLPGLASPGRQNLALGEKASREAASEAERSANPPAEPTPASAEPAAPAAPEEPSAPASPSP